MKKFGSACILSVGTELLMGQIVNTNAAFLASELARIGIPAYRQAVVGDNPDRLADELRYALSKNDLVITTGGLGPTEDDITCKTAAKVLGRQLILHKETEDNIRGYFSSSGKEMPVSVLRQAMVPEGSMVLENPVGTAPGIIMEHDLFSGGAVVLLPGPPNEMKGIFSSSLKEYLERNAPIKIVSEYIHLVGIGESSAEEKIKDIIAGSKNPTIAPYCSDGQCMFRVSYTDNGEGGNGDLKSVVEEIRERLGDNIYEIGTRSLEQVVFDLLVQQGSTVSFAESCTGGLLSAAITDIPGASEVFKGSVAAYSNEVKIDLLGVDPDTIQNFGAVSEQTASEMASGCKKIFGTDFSVAVTGVAGPGHSENKPVGLVYMAVCSDKGITVKETMSRGNRARIRRAAVLNALDMLRREMTGNENQDIRR